MTLVPFGPATTLPRRGVAASRCMYASGVQPPSAILLKRNPYENAQATLSSM